MISYGLGRAAIEGLRTDSLYFFGTGIRSSQMLGLLSALVGIALYAFRLKTAGPASPPFVKAKAGPEGESAVPPAEAGAASAPVEKSALAEESSESDRSNEEEENEDGGDAD